jgi:hypothetical protein
MYLLLIVMINRGQWAQVLQDDIDVIRRKYVSIIEVATAELRIYPLNGSCLI